MATKEFWVGSVGALLYDDGETYPDAVSRVALRGTQVYLEESPTEDEHALRKVDMPSFSSDAPEQGDIWYFNGTIWSLLHHGTAGQVLKTGGHGANPAWNDEALDDLSDVVISSPVAGDFLYYNGTNWVHRTQDGWIADADTYVYVSATSFKIAGKDVTARFPVGCKLKLTQTTAKYFYVVSAAFSNDTTVTITGGSDYSLANAAIDSPYYSYQSSPQGFPQWFNYTPSWEGFSVDPSANNFSIARFKIEGRLVTQEFHYDNNGTSNANYCRHSKAVLSSYAARYYSEGTAVTYDSATSVWTKDGNRCYVVDDSNWITIGRNNSITGWSTSGAKNAAFKITWMI